MSIYVSNDFDIDVARDAILKYSQINKFGHNPDLDAGIREDIWVTGGIYVFPSDSGESIQIQSSSALDTVQVKIFGLDQNFLLVEETVTLTGQTPVPLSGLWSRVFRGFVDDSTESVGTITVTDVATNTNVYVQIGVEEQQTSQVIYTVPADCTGWVVGYGASVNRGAGSGGADFFISVRSFGKVFLEKIHRGLQVAGTSTTDVDMRSPIRVPPKADIKMSGTSTSNNTGMSGYIDIKLIYNTPGTTFLTTYGA